jgi:hypothetical protein
MSRILECTRQALLAGSMGLLFVLAVQAQDLTPAPIPVEIASSKKVFISNGGEETFFHLPKDDWYAGGPNRTYNEFYAAMKSWGRFQLAHNPADSDLIFEIGFSDRTLNEIHFKLTIVEPRTRVPLWTIFEYVEWAGTAKNREKNYDSGMNALVAELKLLVAPPPAPAKQN